LLSNPTALASPNAEPLTSDGQIMGTLDYMAPEQMGNAHEIDVRADFYALGCTLHALFTGAAPFAGAEYPTLYDKIAAHREKPPPDVATWRSDIPPELNRVLRRLLSKSPDDRPTTSSAVAAELLPFTTGHDL